MLVHEFCLPPSVETWRLGEGFLVPNFCQTGTSHVAPMFGCC